MTPRERDALLELYRELDGELSALAPAGCRACGECCRFDRAEHVLYASRLERELLGEADRPPSPDSPDLLDAGLACPFQVGGKCEARKARALGCRVHFCEHVGNAPGWEFSERWHRRLKELHEELGAEWDYRALLPL